MECEPVMEDRRKGALMKNPPAWRNVTLDSRDPEAWRLSGKRMKINLVRSHVYYPESWYMYCTGLDLRECVIGPDSLSAEEAQRKALQVVDRIVAGLVADLVADLEEWGA